METKPNTIEYLVGNKIEIPEKVVTVKNIILNRGKLLLQEGTKI